MNLKEIKKLIKSNSFKDFFKATIKILYKIRNYFLGFSIGWVLAKTPQNPSLWIAVFLLVLYLFVISMNEVFEN